MDPLAHTLIGATIAETPLHRRTPLARTTLLIAANLPDIDASCGVIGRDFALGFRRGHTHGVLAMLVLPLVLTGLIVAFDRRFRQPKGKAPVDARWVLALAYIGVLSHPALDWLNNYGVRLLMPFSGEWFYGDSIFIIDPWIWLVAASALVLRYSRTKKSIVLWSALALLCSALVLSTSLVPFWVKATWVVGVAAILGIRKWSPSPERVAVAALVILGVYILANVALTAMTRRYAREWFFGHHGVRAELVVVGPVPAQPLRRDVIIRAEGVYYFAFSDPAGEKRFGESHPSRPMNDGPIARRALAKRPGLERWIRLPAFVVTEVDGGHEVAIRDVRYDRMGASLGRVTVRVP